MLVLKSVLFKEIVFYLQKSAETNTGIICKSEFAIFSMDVKVEKILLVTVLEICLV